MTTYAGSPSPTAVTVAVTVVFVAFMPAEVVSIWLMLLLATDLLAKSATHRTDAAQSGVGDAITIASLKCAAAVLLAPLRCRLSYPAGENV